MGDPKIDPRCQGNRYGQVPGFEDLKNVGQVEAPKDATKIAAPAFRYDKN